MFLFCSDNVLIRCTRLIVGIKAFSCPNKVYIFLLTIICSFKASATIWTSLLCFCTTILSNLWSLKSYLLLELLCVNIWGGRLSYMIVYFSSSFIKNVIHEFLILLFLWSVYCLVHANSGCTIITINELGCLIMMFDLIYHIVDFLL